MDKEVGRMKFDTGDDSREYKVEVIQNCMVYAKELESDHLPGFYCLVS